MMDKIEKRDENGRRNEDQRSRYTPSIISQIFLSIIVNVSILSPGMSVGFSGIALPTLTSLDNPYRLNTDQASWFASISAITTPIGCLISGPLLDRYGRKITIYFINLFMFAGWAIIATAKETDPYLQLLIGRFIAGIGAGLSSIPATVYVSEIATPKLRGMLVIWTTAAFAIGVLLIYTIGYFLKESWHISAWISGGIPVVAAVLVYFLIPESPVWLQHKNRLEEAETSRRRISNFFGIAKTADQEHQYVPVVTTEVQKLPNDDDKLVGSINSVYNETVVETPGTSQKLWTKLKDVMRNFTRPECVKPLLIMSAYFFFQQFSGIFTIIYYAVDIIQEAGVTADPYLVTIVIGVTRVVAAIFIGHISKWFGRKPPSIVSGAGMAVCMFALAGYLYLLENEEEVLKGEHMATWNSTQGISMFNATTTHTSKYDYLKWVPITTLVVYFFISTIGFLSIPFAMIGEIYPTSVRGLFGGLTSCIAYVYSFIIVKLYPTMLAHMGRANLFLFYGSVAFVGMLFVIFFLPETKGKTLDEIERMFKKDPDGVDMKTQDEDELESILEDGKKIEIVPRGHK